MKAGWLALAVLGSASVGLPGGAAAAPTAKAQAADWTRAVAMTPAGGFRMGNPAAKVKLVEYGSLTCPHCAHFAAEGTAGVRDLVKSGKLSFEYRNFVLNAPDIAASLLARCGGGKTFFPLVDSMYAAQKGWLGALVDMSDEQKREIAALPANERLARLAKAAGLEQLSAKMGIPPAKARQCLGDKAGIAAIEKLHADGVKLGVVGTPTFFIDGTRSSALSWAQLEPELRAALGKSR